MPVLAITLGVTLAACGASQGASGRTRPIDDILAGPIEVADLTSAGAVVQVSTSVPVVCSVVYGTDQRYGSQSTDPDMGGSPHEDHRAPLRGLQPDTLYHYRLQGSGPDGAIYVSNDLTFRTPAESGEGGVGRNVATQAAGARVVEVSSVYANSSSWAAGNALDGDPATEWSSAGDGDRASITIELDKAQDLKAVGLWTRTMGSTAQIKRFRVVAEDGQEIGEFEIPDASRMYTFPVSVRARRLQFEVVASSGGNTGAVEIGAFADE